MSLHHLVLLSVLSFFSLLLVSSIFFLICLSSLSVKQVTLSQEIRNFIVFFSFPFPPIAAVVAVVSIKIDLFAMFIDKKSPCNMSSYHRNIQRGEQFNWKIHHRCIFVLSDVHENHHMCDKQSDSCAVEVGNGIEKNSFLQQQVVFVFSYIALLFSHSEILGCE